MNATYYKSAGAVGCITDGGVRDLQEMKNVGFHAMSRGVTISHAFGVSLENCGVTISFLGDFMLFFPIFRWPLLNGMFLFQCLE